jgi:hypothetical protein
MYGAIDKGWLFWEGGAEDNVSMMNWSILLLSRYHAQGSTPRIIGIATVPLDDVGVAVHRDPACGVLHRM